MISMLGCSQVAGYVEEVICRMPDEVRLYHPCRPCMHPSSPALPAAGALAFTVAPYASASGCLPSSVVPSWRLAAMQARVPLNALFFTVPAAEVSAALEPQPGGKEQVRPLPLQQSSAVVRNGGTSFQHRTYKS